MLRGLLASRTTGSLCWKTGEEEKGAVPRLPQLALTALCFIIHSKLVFEKGHIFKSEVQNLSPDINKHTAQQPLPGLAILLAQTVRDTN